MKLDTRILPLVLALAFSAAPAFAAEDANTITVIQEDGSKVTVDMGEPDAILPGRDAPLPARKQVEPPPVPVAPVEAAPLDVKPVEAKPYVDEIVAPESRAEPADAAPAPAPVKEKKTAKAKKSGKKKKAPPVPPRPPAQKEIRDAEGEVIVREISERMAASIALETAPPSTSFTSMRQSYKGADVYVVTFKTPEGPYDVLVDVVTGDVVVQGYVENEPESGPTKPGHLPQDWQPYKPVTQPGIRGKTSASIRGR